MSACGVATSDQGPGSLSLGVLAAVMAVTSVGLVVIQAFVVRTWCTLCLASAAISWALAALAIPEALTEFRRPRTPRPSLKASARRPVHH